MLSEIVVLSAGKRDSSPEEFFIDDEIVPGPTWAQIAAVYPPKNSQIGGARQVLAPESCGPVYGPHPRWWYTPSLNERKAFQAFVEEEEAKVGRAPYQRVQVLEELLRATTSDWHVRYLYRRIRCIRHAAQLKRKAALYKKAQHQKRQEEWYLFGGREAAYRRNHPFGELDHVWFQRSLADVAPMPLDIPQESWDDEEPSPLRGGRLRKPREEPVFYGPYHRPAPPPKKRNPLLLARLRAIIADLQAKRAGTFVEPTPWPTKFEMQEGAHGEDSAPSIVQHSNIVITEQHGASVSSDTPAAPAAKLVSSDIVDSYTDLVTRELLFKTFEWSKEEQNAILFKADLPRDFIISIDGTPNAVPFNFNRYMRGDMLVRIQINANPFMIGSLQASWFYHWDADASRSWRDNIASGSQTLHTIINAGTSNEGILRIPYKNFKPLLEIGQRKDKTKSLYLGRLAIRVLNKLEATSVSSNAASVSVFISFDNTEFTGYVHRDINKPEMEVAAAIVAGKVAEKMLDANRDKPTASAKPSYYAPQTSESWSHGTGESEQTYDLRLQRADTPHPLRYTDADFTQRDVVQRYGYVRTLEWPASTPSGSQLFAFPAEPMMDKGMYRSVPGDKMESYVLPPVAYVSNLFQYWRGSLKLRLDFVATKFHTGRLLLTYVPGDYQADLQLSHVKASTSVVFDLKESQQCNFVIPYMADKQYWPRKYEIHKLDAMSYSPGYVYIFVINKLISMDTIPNVVPINMYIAGAEDFECIIPAQPTIGLGYMQKVLTPVSTNAYITNGESHYIGTYTDLELNNVSEALFPGIMRYGPLFGHLSQLWMPKKPDYENKKFYYLTCVKWSIPVRSTVDKKEADTSTKVAIPFYDGDYIYVMPVRSETLAEDWCKKMIAAKGNYKQFATAEYCRQIFYNYPKGDDADPYAEGKYFNVIEVTSGTDDWDIVAKFEMDPRTSEDQPILSGVSLVPSTSYGKSELGEMHGDFKDICRRYQLYAQVTVPKRNENKCPPNKVLLRFPVLPQGLDTDVGTSESPNLVQNFMREGLIPMLLSGYRFFRGSIRYRVILPEVDGAYFVQHIPYMAFSKRQATVVGEFKDSRFGLNHGYAYAIQSRQVNGVLSFEVPYYLNVDCMLLQQSISGGKGINDLDYALSLGMICIGMVKPPAEQELSFEILYSLGDDARPSVFQGFAPVIFTGDIVPVATKFEMFSRISKTLKFTQALGDVNLNQVEEKTIEALSSVKDASSSMNQLIDKLQKTGASASTAYTEMLEAMKSAHAPHVLITALSQCMHVVYNPDPVVMGIAVGSFLLTLGVVGFDAVRTIVDTCTTYFRVLLSEHPEGGESKPQSDFDTNDLSALASILFTGVSTALNVKATSNSKFTRGLAADLVSGLGSGARDGSFFFRFLTNIMGTLVKIYDYIIEHLFPEKLGLEHLVTERELVSKWCEQCVKLLAPENESVYDMCPTMVDQVHSAYVLGSVIMAKLATVPKGVNTSVIKDFYFKIVKLRTELYDKGYGGTFRREPYVVWMGGEPGIGKSHLSTMLCLEMLNYIELPIIGAPIYYHPAGAKYWENLHQEPVIMMDDAFITRTGELNESEIGTFMSIKSPCLFTPPMAECDRKKKRYAPELVYVNSNNDFPSLSNMESPKAIFRRRDLMWIAELRPEYAGQKVRDLPENVLDQCDHLRFRRVPDPSERIDRKDCREVYSFAEMKQITCETFKQFRDKQIMCSHKKAEAQNTTVNRFLADPRFASDPLADYIKRYAEIHSYPQITQFLPEAYQVDDAAAPQAPVPVVNVSEDVECSVSKNIITFCSKHEEMMPIEHAIVQSFVRVANQFRRDVTAGIIGESLKDGRLLPGQYLKFFALGFKFIALLEHCHMGNGLRILYSNAREKNPMLHSGCVQALRDSWSADFLLNHGEQILKLDGILADEAVTLLMRLKELDEGIAQDLYHSSVDIDAMVADTPESLVEVIVEQPSVNPPLEPEVIVASQTPEMDTPVVVVDTTPAPPPPKPRARTKKPIAVQVAPETKAPQAFAQFKKDLATVLTRERQDWGRITKEAANEIKHADEHREAAQWEPKSYKETKTLLAEHKPKTICDQHSQYLFERLMVKNKAAGAKIVGSAAEIANLETAAKFQEFIRKNLATDSPKFCAHWFTAWMTYSTVSTHCCFDNLNVRHWCRKKFCLDPDCIAYYPVILDEPCPGHCGLKSWYTRRILRALWIKYTTNGASLISENDPLVPQVYRISTPAAILSSLKESLNSMFASIWSALKAAAGMLCSAVASVFRFIKRYKWVFVTIAGLVGGYFVYKNRDSVSTHAVAVIHTTPSEIVDGVRTLYSGTRDNVKDLFRSVRNVITPNKATGDLGEVSEVELMAAPEMVSSSDPRMTQRSARASFKATTLARVSGKAPSKAESSQNHNVLRRLLIKNTVMLVGYSGDVLPADLDCNNSNTVRGLFLGDRFCLTVAHSWEVFSNSGNERIGFFIRDRWISCKLNSVDCISMSDDVLCVLEFPACVPQFRTIVNFIASEADHCIRTPSAGTLIKIDDALVEVLVPITPRLEKLPVSGTRLTRSVVADSCYQYPVQANGLCGSVLVAADRPAPIFGMHFAGNDGTRIGYSMPLFRETFEPLFNMKPKFDFAYQIEDVLLDPSTAMIDINTCVFEIGRTKRSHEHTSASKTEIKPSAIHDFIPHVTEPAPLHPKDPRLPPGNSPLVRGVEKHGVLTDDFPNDVFLRTRERLRTFLIVNNKPHRKVELPTLTEQQAVCGDPALPFCDPLAWDTSEGYPWFARRPPGATNKKWLFNLEETNQGLRFINFHPKLEAHLYGLRNNRRSLLVNPIIFTDCLKDARIPIEKVPIPGKTRIFSMSPIDYTIDFRIYFYDFISSFQLNRFSCANMIGINVFSDEWNCLAHTLLRHNNICTGDYSNFGPGLNMQVAEACCDVILEWYDYYWPATDQGDKNIRKCMLAELINAFHLCKDLIYRVGAGIPSGSPLTVVLNSLVNIFYIFAAWDMLSVNWDPFLQSFQNFQENVVLYTYGDDFIFSVSELYKDLFNTKTVSEILGKYKIKLTDAFKKEEVTAYTTLQEASFLKNRFIRFDNRYWAALDKDSIHDMCNWVRDSPDLKQATVDNCEAALLHMQAWGRRDFHDFRSRLIKILGEKGIEFQPRTWDQIVKLKLGSGSDPSYAAYLHKMVG